MGDYYNAGGGCFAGECFVNLINNETKKISEIKRGD